MRASRSGGPTSTSTCASAAHPALRRARQDDSLLVRVLLVLALPAAAIAAFTAFHHHGAAPRAAAAATARKPTAKLDPPGPIPGYLLIADRGNNRMLLVDSAHHVFWRYPGGGRRAMPFVFDDDTFFGPKHDRIISNQEDQDTIQIVSFPGKRVLWRYGHVDVKSGARGYLNTPDDAYLLKNGLVSVADAYNCRVLFISPAHRIVAQYGTTGTCRHDPPHYLGAVNGATPLADGGTLISEIAGSWIDDVGPNGRLRWAVQAPVAYPSDPQLLGADRILLADYSYPGAAIIMTRTGKVVWRYRPTSGDGELNHPSLAMRIAPGLIAINDDYRDRVVLVSIRTHRIVWQYGHTDRPGTADGYLHTPDGLDLLTTADAQRYRTLLAPRTAPTKRARGIVVTTPFRLPAPVQREVAVASRGGILLAGGLDTAQQSTTGVFRLSVTGHLTSLGTVPVAFHDAAGAVIGNALYVFGGGAASSSSTVQRFDLATHRSSVVAHLPRPLSDLQSAVTPSGVYLVGGYDGVSPRREIYRTTDGTHFSLVATLPTGARYAAVAALGNTVVIANGSTVYTLGRGLHRVASLPTSVNGDSAFALDGHVYVAGTSTYRVYPGPVQRVAVAVPVTNAGTTAAGGSAWIVGGADAGGSTASVRRVSVRG